MKQGWQICNLSDVFWFQEGPGIRTTQFTAEGVKLLNVSNITKSGTLELKNSKRYLSKQDVETRYQHFLVDPGDLVIASSGISFDTDELLRTRGVFVREEHLPLVMNTSTIRFKAVNGKSDLRYLRHWLQSREFRVQISRFVTGSAQQNFGPSHLKSLRIALPPLEEQRRIAAILDQAEALRAKRRQALAKLDTLTQSLFLEMFGDPASFKSRWPIRRFRELFEKPLRNGLSPSNVGSVKGSVLTLSAVTGGRFDPSAIKDATFHTEPPDDQTVDQRDFLVCRGNGNLKLVGKGQFPNITMPSVLFPDTMIAARLSPNVIEREFLQYIWNSSTVRSQLESLARTTNGTHKINQTMVEGIELIYPPLEHQRDFSQRMRAIGLLRKGMYNALRSTEVVVASLQDRAFRGEL